MTIFSPGAGHDTFTVDTGEIVFVPKGYLHHIENINHGETKFVIAFNHEKPEDIGISGSTGSMTDNVLGATFGLEFDYFGKFKKSSQDLLITSNPILTMPHPSIRKSLMTTNLTLRLFHLLYKVVEVLFL